MYKAKVTLGVLPTRRGMLDLETATREKEKFMAVIREIKPEVVTLVDVDDICTNGIIENESYSPAVVEKFRKANVDAIFVPFCDFGDEGSVADVVSRFQVPVLVWGARDERPNTLEARGRDTQCGMFAATKVLRRYGVTYSYIFNVAADTEEFRQGFENFIRVACIVKDVRGLRIGKIGEHPGPFRSVMTNETKLMKDFGAQTVAIAPLVVQMTVEKILAAKSDEFERTLKDLKERMDCSAMTDEDVERLVAFKMALLEVLAQNNCNVAAIECWPTCAMMKLPACAVIGELTDMGIPVSCETDINGAITMAILRACTLGEQAEFLADLTIRHPENDNAELLWHCGPFPYSLKAAESKARIVGGQEQFELKQGDLTVCRFDEIDGEYYLFAGEARTTTGPETMGTYVWMETDNWKKWEEKLMFGPYIHHLGGIYGKMFPVLKEAARYLGVKLDSVEECGPSCL